MAAERLQKVLARSGVASRRGAEELISAGRVAVNGETAHIGQSADPDVDRITLDGRPVGRAERLVHYALHKPAGYVSSSRDERGRRSVVRLLAREERTGIGRLWPAGRLDADSEGLLVLTNDGAWANRFLHPRHGVEREYAVLVDGTPDAGRLSTMVEGVELSDGPARLLSASIDAPPDEVARDPAERGTWVRLTVGEGRKREVRRIVAAAGLRVLRLVRVRFGTLSLDGLTSGHWRTLAPAEVAGLAGEPTEEQVP